MHSPISFYPDLGRIGGFVNRAFALHLFSKTQRLQRLARPHPTGLPRHSDDRVALPRMRGIRDFYREFAFRLRRRFFVKKVAPIHRARHDLSQFPSPGSRYVRAVQGEIVPRLPRRKVRLTLSGYDTARPRHPLPSVLLQEVTIAPQSEHADARADRLSGPLQIVYRPIDELKLNPQSARKHSRKKLEQLARSLDSFGFVTPALVDAEDRVIAGNARIQAARQLGRTHVPTIRLEHLSEAKRRALTIADNRLAECASWDQRLLAQELQHLCSVELDFNIEVTGLALKEIELKIAGVEGLRARIRPTLHPSPVRRRRSRARAISGFSESIGCFAEMLCTGAPCNA